MRLELCNVYSIISVSMLLSTAFIGNGKYSLFGGSLVYTGRRRVPWAHRTFKLLGVPAS